MEYQLGSAPRLSSKPTHPHSVNTRRAGSVPTLRAFGAGWFFRVGGVCFVLNKQDI